MTHRLCSSRATMLLLCFALPAAVPGPARSLPPDNEPAARTVPLPHVLRDDTGVALTVNADGSVNDGQGDLFDAGAQLFVGNNFQYAPEIAQATYDARHNELLFPPMPANGLNVSRRVSVDARTGWWRFVETLENPGPAPVRAQVRVRFDLAGAIQAVEQVDDEQRGNSTVGVAVFDGDDGIALLGAGRAAGRHAARPQFVAQPNSDGVDLVYDLEVAPRKTMSIVHGMAARASINEAANLLRSAKDADLLRGLTPDVLRTLVNFSVADRLVGDVEILRGELFDVVELRGGDVYKGTLREERFRVRTPYGLIELPAERVVAMVTLGQFRPTQLVVTADGEIFGGALMGDSIHLELSSGQVTAVPLAGVRRFGYRRRADEPEDALPRAGKPLVMLRAGDRIAVEAPSSPLVIATCYGTLRLDPRTVASVAFQSEEHGVHEVRLVDGSHFAGVVGQDRFDLTRPGGKPGAADPSRAVSFAAASVRRLQFAPDIEEPPSDAPRLELSNGDLLVGGLAGKVVLETAFDAIEVEAEGLQGLRQGGAGVADAGGGAGASPTEVQLTLWDGTTVSGRVRGDVIDCTLRCGATVRVPVEMVGRYTQPRPRPSPKVVERIKAVVADLNADDWKTRDRAAAQLASIGAASAAVLKELRDGQPPEVRQRIDQILASFEPKPEVPPAVLRPAGDDAPVDVDPVPPERG